MMKKIISIMAGGVLLAATMSGCVDDNPTFVIRGLVPINSTCEAGSDTDETIAQELHYILNEEDKQIVEKTVDIVGLSRYMKTPIGQLSDGERQKIMTAKALAQETPIILLDEPTSFLDFQSKVEMMKLLRDLAHDMEKTIVLSTHDLMLAEKMGDKLWWMESTLQPISKDRLSNYLTDVLDTTVERTRML